MGCPFFSPRTICSGTGASPMGDNDIEATLCSTNITMDNREFSHEKWWFSIVMLNYQRVKAMFETTNQKTMFWVFDRVTPRSWRSCSAFLSRDADRYAALVPNVDSGWSKSKAVTPHDLIRYGIHHPEISRNWIWNHNHHFGASKNRDAFELGWTRFHQITTGFTTPSPLRSAASTSPSAWRASAMRVKAFWYDLWTVADSAIAAQHVFCYKIPFLNSLKCQMKNHETTERHYRANK